MKRQQTRGGANNEADIDDGFKNIIFVPFGWIKLCWYAAHVDKYTEEQHFKLLKYIDHRANWEETFR